MIARFAGNKDCDIQPCYSYEYPSPVTRPHIQYWTKNVQGYLNITVPYWVDSLEICIKNIQK